MSALEELANLCGIEDRFLDANGIIRQTSAKTRCALLTAMGFQVENSAAAQRSLAEFKRRTWDRVLPPVRVIRQSDAAATVELTLPSETAKITWQLSLEGGETRQGEVLFAALDLLDERALDERAAAGKNPEKRQRRRLDLGRDLPLGYHRLSVFPDQHTVVIVVPPKCWLPPRIEKGERLWGVATQLYLLRSDKNWGIGDYGDLRQLAELLSEHGADVIGLNPLHAMFLDQPEHASPYSPESRLLLNVLNIDVPLAIELVDSAEARALLQSEPVRQKIKECQAAPLVDYSVVADLKLKLLRQAFASCTQNRGSRHWQSFLAFRGERGHVLEQSCLYEALRAHFAQGNPPHADWRQWPEPYRDPRSASVAKFADEHGEAVTFLAWLQFIADLQLAAAAKAAQQMAVGLYRDLAVGADPAGAETWVNQAAVVSSAAVGAPPDIYNVKGQNWGLPPFNPQALYEEAYQSFIELVRENMRHAGGLRIDHVMALRHLYWIPEGQPPSEGAYVAYPQDDLVGILALESHRNHCLVVGEDLGTVPDGFREQMADANILSYRVLFFEKDGEAFLKPSQYPLLALAVAGSHDLPTLRGWWEAHDIKLKQTLGLFNHPDEADQALRARGLERKALLKAFQDEGLVNEELDLDIEALIRVAHAYLARSQSAIAMAQIDDICCELGPVNVPTTATEHPNWRRRLSLSLTELAAHPRLRQVVDSFHGRA